MNNKNIKLYILIFSIFLFTFIILPNKVLGKSRGYTIKNYNIDINVNENNSFDITETITANFSQEQHGIIRNIPRVNYIKRNDGTTAKNIALITDIEVNEPYTKSNTINEVSLKIGSASETILGEHTYTIKYKYYLLGRDGLANQDEFYFNLIGTEWDTSIENASFKITMPKEFDPSLLGFSSGYKDSKDSSNIQYTVNGNIIAGNIKTSLKSNQGITIRLTLPEGYFFNILNFLYEQYMNIILIIGGIFLLIAFLLWLRYGKDGEVVETVEFYPPIGYNSTEVGYIYSGTASDEAIISIMIQLANKGYIKIEEIESKGIIKRKTFQITKLKEYFGDDNIEKIFFDGLFKYGEPNQKDIEEYFREARQRGEKIKFYQIESIKKKLPIKPITEKELKNKFYPTIAKIRELIEKDRNNIYEKNDKRQKKITSMTNLLSLLALCNVFIQSNVNFYYAIFAIAFLEIAISTIIEILFFNRKKTVGDLIILTTFMVISAYLIKKIIYPMMIANPGVRNFYIIILIQILGLIAFNVLMLKRTKHGNEILGQIKGFRKFLENAEKEQLEALVEENPEYFYDILPYTYALGVSKKWIQQFETIAIRPPNWYDSEYDLQGTENFIHMIDDTVREVAYSMKRETENVSSSSTSSYSSDRTSSSSDRDSGGGSTGGGSGGRRR